jgi:VWFA-related protein
MPMTIISRVLRTIFILTLAMGCVLTAGAQSQPQTPAQPQTQQDQDKQETFKIDVGIVNILFNVKDKHGMLIPGLKKQDFEINEDGKPQTIKYFAAESNLPLTLGILIDTSGSQERVLPMEQEVGASFLKSVLRDKDLAFLINFDIDVELDQDFTNSVRELRAGLDKMKINTGGKIFGGPGVGQGPVPMSHPKGTLLYDAIYLAADEKLKHEVGRKAIIILTDGEDQGSRLRVQDAIEAAQKSDAICYVLMIADRGFYGTSGYSGDSQMHKLAEQTGGRVIDVGNDQRKLREAFDQIGAELRSQYSIGYISTNNTRDGKFRTIEIQTKGGKIQARKGYYATKQ